MFTSAHAKTYTNSRANAYKLCAKAFICIQKYTNVYKKHTNSCKNTNKPTLKMIIILTVLFIGIGNGNIIYIAMVRILKDIGNGNVMWFCNYNRNQYNLNCMPNY